jgi:DNA-binding IscR family transcriptional regulator
MRLTRRSEYGLRALTDLVRSGPRRPFPLRRWPGATTSRPKFLEQIMATLKHGGIVRTHLGARGGYAMADDPAADLAGSRHPACSTARSRRCRA